LWPQSVSGRAATIRHDFVESKATRSSRLTKYHGGKIACCARVEKKLWVRRLVGRRPEDFALTWRRWRSDTKIKREFRDQWQLANREYSNRTPERGLIGSRGIETKLNCACVQCSRFQKWTISGRENRRLLKLSDSAFLWQLVRRVKKMIFSQVRQ
jgi:hypothetical protein